MIDLNLLRRDPDRVRQAIRHKGAGRANYVDEALGLDQQRREKLAELHDVQAEANAISEEIGELKQNGQEEEAQACTSRATELKERVDTLEGQAEQAEKRLHDTLLEIPNVPHSSVPVGHDETDNKVVGMFGSPPSFDFDPVPHWDLADHHGLVDFERGAKVTGSGFPFYVERGARLQRGLINFFLDRARERGYTELQPPFFVDPESAKGTGQLPDKDDLMYEMPRDDFYPIPTAEVPVSNFHRNEILSVDDLPLQYCAYSPCWRREAGSYGSDVRGLNRLHQFDKVELVHIVHPDQSYRALYELLADAESTLDALGLPYRRLLMCTGDMGFTQTKKYDLEVWSAAQERWLEVSSVSNFEDFQARRMQIRYRPEPGAKPELVHTLNGSGLALPRIVAALLENNQQPDGSIELPEVLHPYVGFARIR
jgi:seryl-tRNA synthetase